MSDDPKTQGRPANLVGEINGHQMYRAADGVKVNLYTPGVGWWAFGVDEGYARRLLPNVCEVVMASRTE